MDANNLKNGKIFHIFFHFSRNIDPQQAIENDPEILITKISKDITQKGK